jgi:2-polyprenyl-3-methyl-5-hydroxy-6-metoxy-1,4-benzoquinol methylase
MSQQAAVAEALALEPRRRLPFAAKRFARNIMTYYSNPKKYWEERLTHNFGLGGVGNIGFAERYNRWLYRRKLRCLQAALRGIRLQGKRVLDVGCGTGFFVEWYLGKGCQVTGIDITEISVNRLRETSPGEFYTRDITAADYQNSKEKFDLVNMWDVIYHIVDKHAYSRALDNISNDLADGGLLLLTDFLGSTSDTRVAPHVLGRCLKTHAMNLQDRGFKLVEVRPLFKFLAKSNLGRFDNYLGPVYFFLDNFVNNVPTDSVALSVWRR